MQRLSSKAQGLTCSCCCLRGGSNESRRVVKRECRHPEIGGQTKSGQRKTSHSEREAYSQRADVHGDRRRRIVGECCEPKTTNFPTNLGTTDLVCYLFSWSAWIFSSRSLRVFFVSPDAMGFNVTCHAFHMELFQQCSRTSMKVRSRKGAREDISLF